jgi:hypothetical protein
MSTELDALRGRVSSLRARLHALEASDAITELDEITELEGKEFCDAIRLFSASLNARLDACLPIMTQCEQGAISAQAAREAIRRALA